MRKFLSIVLVVLLSVGAATACVKKQSPITNLQSPLTVIVMDTTQALLFDAQVKVGKKTFKTSFDGRVVLKPEQVEGVKVLSVTCDGYKEAKNIDIDANLLIVKLKNDKSKKTTEVYYTGLGASRRIGSRGDAKYVKALAAAPMEVEVLSVAEDGMAYEEARDVVVAGYGMPGVTKETAHIEPSVNTNISAGKLTAGEVNDFTKWSFWPKVLDETHKQFINTWKIAPRQRYTVQVKTKDGYPVANYPVNLTDENGNTLFQAVTDNTGKAELWANLMTNGQPVNVKEPEKTIVLDEPCNNDPSSITNEQSDVDVVFIFDATGSMGDELRYLQAEMKDVIARAKEATGGLNIRTGAVVYRDHGDEYLTRISRLTEDIKTTQAFIDKQEASGGGDYPEAVPEALMAALNSAGWNEYARARVAFLILDAPCHEDSATLALLHDQILNAAAIGVRIVPVVCSGLGESGEFLLRSMALATNGTSFFLTDDSGIGNPHLKPTTDSLKVEHLNDMLVRTIVEFSYMPQCDIEMTEEQLPLTDESFLPNPFGANEIEQDPTIPHGEGVHYLLDVSGKLLAIFEGEMANCQSQIAHYQLPVGIYFIKTFYNGQWHTEKILVR